MLETLKSKMGPLPVWAWALILIVLIAWYMKRRQSQQAAAQQQQNQQQGTSGGNTPSIPVSNLSTAAEPMPIQLGDTFVNTGTGGGISTNSGSPNTTLISPVTPSNSLQAAGAPAASPATNIQ